MKKLWMLFWTFTKIGLFTFGGGYAMLPMLQKEIVEKQDWATEEEIMDYFAIGQCTPGVIAVNTATFIGYKQCGILGGIFATLGVIFPSIVIIIFIASILSNLMDYAVTQYIFNGIRLVVASLVLNVVIKMYRSSVSNFICVLLFWGTLFLGLVLDLSPVYFIVISGLIGVIAFRRGEQV